jgi:DNA-binding FadR family transcriptional regulator
MDESTQPKARRYEEDLRRIHDYLDRSGLSEQDRLPAERELAEVLGLSRSRLRSALKRLSKQDVVWRHVGKGTFIGPAPVSGTQTSINMPDLGNPREIMEARLMIEPELARLASIRGTRKDFEEMDACLEKLSGSENQSTWHTWDTRLHRTIAKAAENKILLAVFDLVHSNRSKEIWGNLREILNTPDRMRDVHREHLAFTRAIQLRAPKEAEDLMRAHLLAVRRIIFREE